MSLFLIALLFTITLVGGEAPMCTREVSCEDMICPAGSYSSVIVSSLAPFEAQMSFLDFYVKFGQLISTLQSFTNSISSDRVKPHVTFMYLCCMTSEQYSVVEKVVDSVQWGPLTLSFDRIVCNHDANLSPATKNSSISVVARLSKSTEDQWNSSIAKVETALLAAGVHLVRRRTVQEFLHSTLAVFSNYSLPLLADALNAVNNPFPWNAVPEMKISFLQLVTFFFVYEFLCISNGLSLSWMRMVCQGKYSHRLLAPSQIITVLR